MWKANGWTDGRRTLTHDKSSPGHRPCELKNQARSTVNYYLHCILFSLFISGKEVPSLLILYLIWLILVNECWHLWHRKTMYDKDSTMTIINIVSKILGLWKLIEMYLNIYNQISSQFKVYFNPPPQWVPCPCICYATGLISYQFKSIHDMSHQIIFYLFHHLF